MRRAAQREEEEEDLRLGDIIRDVSIPLDGLSGAALRVAEADTVSAAREGDVALVGFPYDEGVRRNGGRPGAAEAPAAVWARLRTTGCVPNPELGVDLRELRVLQTGSLPAGLALEEAHGLLTQRVYALVAAGATPVVVGGGNDQSYASACGMIEALEGDTRRMAVVNVDAHLDVRPRKQGRVHSGSPFRELIEDRRFSGRLVEYAAQGHQCSRAHAEYVLRAGHDIHWLSRDVRASGDAVRHFEGVLADLRRGCDAIFISFDIDSIRGADCPGVSCPAVVGLTAEEAFEMCYVAGQEPAVRLFDLSEFNPRVESDRTARLVAGMIYHFLAGRCVSRTRRVRRVPVATH